MSKTGKVRYPAEWVRLTDAKNKPAQVAQVSGQVAQKPTGGRPEGGLSAATRELGIERTEARRSVKITSLTGAKTKLAQLAPVSGKGGTVAG